MSRYGFLASLLGTVVLFAGAGPTEPAVSKPAPAASANTIVNEPMVVFSVTGGTLTGGVHRQMTVYNNGFVTIAKFDTPVFPVQQEIKDVRTANIGSQAALNFLIQLAQNGAVSLPDQQITVGDVPLNTLTILEGKELALSRTFSWWVGTGQYTGVNQAVNGFIHTHFPGF